MKRLRRKIKLDSNAIQKRMKIINKEKIETIIYILSNDIEPKYNTNPRNYQKYKISNGKYYDMFLKIVKFLEDFGEDFNNPMDSMVKDYFHSVYKYYRQFNRIPYLRQLGTSAMNRIHFDEHISGIEKRTGEKYLSKIKIDKTGIRDRITKHNSMLLNSKGGKVEGFAIRTI